MFRLWKFFPYILLLRVKLTWHRGQPVEDASIKGHGETEFFLLEFNAASFIARHILHLWEYMVPLHNDNNKRRANSFSKKLQKVCDSDESEFDSSIVQCWFSCRNILSMYVCAPSFNAHAKWVKLLASTVTPPCLLFILWHVWEMRKPRGIIKVSHNKVVTPKTDEISRLILFLWIRHWKLMHSG